MTPDHMDLVYRVLDDQLVDVDGRRCGRVDDLEFDGGPGEQPRLSAILSGSGMWHRRMPRVLRTAGARRSVGAFGGAGCGVPPESVVALASLERREAPAGFQARTR